MKSKRALISFSIQLNYLFSCSGTLLSALDIKINETDLSLLKLPFKY